MPRHESAEIVDCLQRCVHIEQLDRVAAADQRMHQLRTAGLSLAGDPGEDVWRCAAQAQQVPMTVLGGADHAIMLCERMLRPGQVLPCHLGAVVYHRDDVVVAPCERVAVRVGEPLAECVAMLTQETAPDRRLLDGWQAVQDIAVSETIRLAGHMRDQALKQLCARPLRKFSRKLPLVSGQTRKQKNRFALLFHADRLSVTRPASLVL